MDGTKPDRQVFRHITVPRLRATPVAATLLPAINAFQAFDEFYNLLADAHGYPPYARPPLAHLCHTTLGQEQNCRSCLVVAFLVFQRWIVAGVERSWVSE